MAWSTGLGIAVRSLGREVTAYIQAHPVTTAAVLVGLSVLVVAGLFFVRKYLRPEGERFRRLLADQESVVVLLHPNPDPDAMAAGIGVKHLAASVETEATIRFPGEIRHQENRAFRTILDLDLSVVDSAKDLRDEVVILVDHNEARGLESAMEAWPLAVIDHHPGDGTGRAFTDVRPEYGSCATIVTEYLRTTGFTPVPPTEDPSGVKHPLPANVATGLMYGIMADTNHLTNGCTEAEFRAAAYLYPGVDDDLLDRIANPQVDSEVLDVKATAVRERRVEGAFAVSQVGPVGNVDAIPQAADELLHLEGVTAVVVGGTKEGTLHLSGRSRDDRVHMGRALERAVEDIPQSSAGGHARMGGGQVSLPHLEGLGPGAGMSIAEFSDRLFSAMNGEEVIERREA